MEINRQNIEQLKDSKAVALYHVVYENDNFETAAHMIYDLVRNAQEKYHNKNRILYLDIKGHRNSDGGFDNDMFELQQNFLMGFLSPYLSELILPLMQVKNPKKQRNGLPEEFQINHQTV